MYFSEFIKKHSAAFSLLLLAVLVIAVYVRTLKFDYVNFDDQILVLHNYEFISDYKNIPQAFKKTVFNSLYGDSYYRPVLTLSFAACAITGGKNPFVYHLGNLLLHLAAVFLFFAFLKITKRPDIFIFLFTALFAVHPALAPAVAWIPGRNDILLAIFCFASLLSLFYFFEDGKKSVVKFAVFALALFAAFLTKETSVVVLLVIPFFMYAFCNNAERKDYVYVMLASVFFAAVYMFIRNAVMFGTSNTELSLDRLPNAVQALKVLAVYCGYSVIPASGKMYFDTVSVDFMALFSCVFTAVVLACSLVFNIGRRKVVLFGFAWFVLFLLPLLFHLGTPSNNWLSHRLYCPAAGAALMFMEFFSALSERFDAYKKYLISLLFCLIILFAFAAGIQSGKFENKLVFISNALEEQPDSEMLRLKLAQYYAESGMLDKAKYEIYGIKTKDNLHTPKYYDILGYILCLEGEYSGAVDIFEQLLKINPDSESALSNLCEIYLRTGDYDKARGYAEMLVKIRPDISAYRDKLKTAELKVKNSEAQRLKDN